MPANATGEALTVKICKGETIHTENSYKFKEAAIRELLKAAGFAPRRTFQDGERLFAVTLAAAV